MTVGTGTARFVGIFRARRSRGLRRAQLRKNDHSRAPVGARPRTSRWTKGVRGGALIPRCAGSDMLGHDGGNGHGMLRPDFPRTQVTGFVECAAAQKRSQSDTMTTRPRTSSVVESSARRCSPVSDAVGHICGNGHGTILPGWPRTQVTAFAPCAAAQNQKHADTMTARPRTSSVDKKSARRRTGPPLRRFRHART
ncbi:hypothetical protein HMPREF1219_01836 [Corynebacterium pyruviciproducens ATCC BAA-1742]|uniref:Uncharacterized protein n=1 Tax=Corynebacterium pyruviciproducens ATCC BAA-1742 TaxID=1125779 RepID=S2Z369_9CORY|nr:hypothetical protein HMPREF1219_01836 [Corynebacterium pyruviciproducens ATCC BAA-1742]